MPESTILLVEGNPQTRQAMTKALQLGGVYVEEASGTAEAIEMIQERDPAKFQAVVADAGEFGMAGLELLEWVQSIDNALSVIVMAEHGERAVLEVALRRGAVDFIDKNVDGYALAEAVAKACEKTIKARRLNTAEKNIRAVARMNHLFRSVLVPELAPWLQLHHTPHEEVGGDFVNVIPRPDGGSVMLIGDVSGHDLRAGFVSAYFQGLMRGLCKSGHGLAEICNEFNHILLREWEHKNSKNPMKIEPRTSLSLLAIELNAARTQATVVNCGAPALRVAKMDGSMMKLEGTNMPLGWSAKEKITGQPLSLKEVAMIYMATDGLHDWAERLGNSSMGLAYRLLEERSSPGGTPPDDLLVLRYQHEQKTPASELWHPLGGALKTNENTLQEMAERLATLLKVNLRGSPKPEKLLEVLMSDKKEVMLATLAVRPADGKVKLVMRYADGSQEGVRVLGVHELKEKEKLEENKKEKSAEPPLSFF